MIGPLSVLAACLLPVSAALAVDDLRSAVLALACEVVLLGWLTVDVRRLPWRMLGAGIAAISIAATTWLWGGRDLEVTVTAALRIVTLALPTALMAPRLRTASLSDHLAQRLRLPARGAVAAVAGLGRLDRVFDQWRQITQARRARGLGLQGGPARRARELGATSFALLVAGMRDAGHLAVAMDARGFATAQRRTWAETAPWTRKDTLVLGLGLVVAIVPWFS